MRVNTLNIVCIVLLFNMSLFQEGTLEVENPQSREEDEDLEEQRRRQEELTDLLATGIHAFNYDESTINSSATSFEGAEPNCVDQVTNIRYDDSGKASLANAGQDYKDANYQDQLKVLYEVRVREIQKLQHEFAQYKEANSKENGALKNKAFLAEAEIRHLKISLSNSENLLVEKTEIINNLQQSVVAKDQEIEKLKTVLDEMKLEICTYSATVNELQLKLSDNNPFSVEARKFKSEEVQRAHQDQIVKLETLLQEQSRKNEILEKEKNRLDEELKKLAKNKNEVDEDTNMTIIKLSKKLQHAQEQCKVLFELGEAVKKESDHFKERMEQLESNNKLSLTSDDFKIKKMDKETMMVHLEKLKRMLLDKNIEINSLKTKLKSHEAVMQELFEYRNLLNGVYSSDVKPCNNNEHEELLIFMQRQLQSYQQAVEDRNNQIINLNLVNKELQEKIEEMIQQTRTEIQNLSQKYSLPKLETMSKELKNAEETINELKRQQEKSGEEAAKAIKDLSEEKAKLSAELAKICAKLGVSERDILESDVDIHEVASLKSKCGQVHDQLQQVAVHLEKMSPQKSESVALMHKLRRYFQDLLKKQDFAKAEIEEKLKLWDSVLHRHIENSKSAHSSIEIKESELEDATNAKTMLEGEKFALEYQLQSRSRELEDAKREIKILMENKSILMKELEENSSTIRKLTERINELENANNARKNLFKEFKDVENESELNKTDNRNIEILQNEILKAELLLRQRLEEESVVKMQKIEEQYKKVLTQKAEAYNKEKEKWKNLEAQYRKQFASVLEECGQKMETLEKENLNLIKQIKELVNEYKTYRNATAIDLEKYKKVIIESNKNMEVNNTKWEKLLEYYVQNFSNIQQLSQKKIKDLQKVINKNQTHYELIETIHRQKIKNAMDEWRNKNKM